MSGLTDRTHIGVPSYLRPHQDHNHVWLRRVLDLDLTSTLGRAAWRPQVLCIAVWQYAPRAFLVGPTAWPTIAQLADQLGWAPGLVRRHLELATAAGLLSLHDELSGGE